MKHKLIIPLIFTLTAMGAAVRAVPPPCSEKELLESSDYAVEGTVVKIECGVPYDSGECRPREDNAAGYKPETVSKCTASVKVKTNIKGKYAPGDTAPVPFLKVVQSCENGSHIIPGSPKADLKENTEIRYYSSGLCRYSNLETLGPLPSAQ
ncbi:MAG TPA: hypothetical protein VHC46_00345 [Thermodesulfobacteriota bacterium]|nr:hypothetical protein [Thermodesulfobacteriota bacterium]